MGHSVANAVLTLSSSLSPSLSFPLLYSSRFSRRLKGNNVIFSGFTSIYDPSESLNFLTAATSVRRRQEEDVPYSILPRSHLLCMWRFSVTTTGKQKVHIMSTSANVIELLRSRSCPSAYSWKALLPGWRRDDPLRLSRKHHRIRPSAASCVSFDLYLAVELS